ncbi:EamA family transporter [uncultured Muribaculum sp.]|uniref:DMT family transporter n=1 Tax=uncultured Muribaculum sp. TaxID=1918613 RepID=UPI00259471AC|nr:EamA family transporter [uncultured Muribaculum sp.]
MDNNSIDKGSTSQHNTRNFLAGNACILLATIFWGINVSVTKALIPDWMSAHGITAVRLIGGCILFWIASLFMKHKRIAGHDWLRFFLGGFIGLFGFIYLFVTSLKYGDPIDISIIMTLPPIFVILMGVLFQHRRPSWLECAGVIISFAGAVVVILDAGADKVNGSDRLLGDLLAVASTVCYAFYLVILEGPTKTYKPVTMLRWVFLFAAVPALILVPEMRYMPILHTAEAAPWLEIAFILFCPTFIAYFLVQPAIKSIGSELVSLYQYLLPVFATISAVMMGLGHLKWMQVIAMLIIVGGMVLTNFSKLRKHTGS